MLAGFDSALDRIARCIDACPDDLWEIGLWTVQTTDPWVWPPPGTEPVPERTEESIQGFAAFWCVAYHALWFLDFYLTAPGEPFESPAAIRGGPEELGFAADGAVAVPDRVFGRDALRAYVDHGRVKVHAVVPATSEEVWRSLFTGDHPRSGLPFGTVVQVALDHLVEHGTQMEQMLIARQVLAPEREVTASEPDPDQGSLF